MCGQLSLQRISAISGIMVKCALCRKEEARKRMSNVKIRQKRWALSLCQGFVWFSPLPCFFVSIIAIYSPMSV